MENSKNEIDEASRYLAGMLHEIRTPIQTIVSTTELLNDTSLDNEQIEYVRQIQFSADILLELANNILDFTRIRSNEFKLESIPFDIMKLTEQVVDLISIEAFNRGLEVITDIDYSISSLIVGDPVRIQQIILNLLKNALKFTNEGYIHISLSLSNNNLIFKITDTGIGISEEKKAKLFTEYFQSDISTYRKYGGTGLGLSICKNLVTVMKGEIGVDNNPDGGSIFWFKIPITTSITNKKQEIFNYKNQKVLIVDDNLKAANSLKNKLIFFGINDIHISTNPKECLEILKNAKNDPFSIVFIDMSLPIMDGWHLAYEINNDNSISDDLYLYLLVPEGQMGKDAKMKMLNWFDGYLYKPIKQNRLVDLLNTTKKVRTINYDTVEELELANDDSVKDLYKKNEQLIAQGYKILIAEDHPVNRKLMESFLKKFGADIYIAEDGEKAVQTIRENKDIDLIFMDIQMPQKSGVDATIEIRKDKYKGIIIACTANNDENDFKTYKKIGMNDILVKPFKSNTIKNIIEKWRTVIDFSDKPTVTYKETQISDTKKTWNTSDFFETTNNDINFAINILKTYFAQTNKLITELDRSIINKNYEEIRKIAHKLTGSSGTVSAEKLSEYAIKINKTAKESLLSAVKTSFNDFKNEYKIFYNTVVQWKNNL